MDLLTVESLEELTNKNQPLILSRYKSGIYTLSTVTNSSYEEEGEEGELVIGKVNLGLLIATAPVTATRLLVSSTLSGWRCTTDCVSWPKTVLDSSPIIAEFETGVTEDEPAKVVMCTTYYSRGRTQSSRSNLLDLDFVRNKVFKNAPDMNVYWDVLAVSGVVKIPFVFSSSLTTLLTGQQ